MYKQRPYDAVLCLVPYPNGVFAGLFGLRHTDRGSRPAAAILPRPPVL